MSSEATRFPTGLRPERSLSSGTATDSTCQTVRTTRPYLPSSIGARTWLTVQLGHGFQHAFSITAKAAVAGGTQTVQLLTAGSYTVTVSATAAADNHVLLRFGLRGPGTDRVVSATVDPGTTMDVVVMTDPAKHLIEMTQNGRAYWAATVQPFRAIEAGPPVQGSQALSVRNTTASTPEPTLCQSLLH